MKDKISSNLTMPFVIAMGVAMFFPGTANFLILQTSKNATVLSIIIGSILGFIPILMMVFINKKLNVSLHIFLKQKLKFIGLFLNIILILIAFFILFVNSWQMLDFIISQFLTRTSYYVIAIIFFTIISYIINKGINTASKTSFILYTLTITVAIILWLFLIPYVKLDNIKPIIDTSYTNIIKSSFIFAISSSLPVIYTLDLKHQVKDQKNFNKYLIIGYISALFIVSICLFLIISTNTIEVANILTYPIYSLYKKIQIFGFIERIENFAALQIIVAFYIQITCIIYYLRENISSILNINKAKNILTYVIGVIVPILSILVFKNFSVFIILKITPYIISIIFIIISITFLISIKKDEH